MSSDFHGMLRSPREPDFHEALAALRGIPIEQAIQMLDALCIDEAPELRCRGLEGLVEIAPHRAESVGLRMLGDIDPTVRWWAVYYVSIIGARSGTRIAVPALAHLLTTDTDELVRSLAASALGDIGDASALPALEAAAANDRGTDHEGVPNSRVARKAIQKIMQRTGA